eukprot:4409079-Prymnesium_polylepis.1
MASWKVIEGRMSEGGSEGGSGGAQSCGVPPTARCGGGDAPGEGASGWPPPPPASWATAAAATS